MFINRVSQQLLGAPELAPLLRELDAGIHAQCLGCVVGRKRDHGPTGIAADLQNVGQIVFPLGVVVAHLFESVEEHRGVEAVEAGVAFGDGGLIGRAILLLHDAHHVVRAGGAHDASVAGRIGHVHGEHDHGSARLFAARDKRADGFGLDEGAVS